MADNSDPFLVVSEAHYSAVGKVASCWASLEHNIQRTIWTAAGIDFSKGACITTQIGNSGRMIDALIALIRLNGTSDADVKPLLRFAEDLSKKQRLRNRIVHDEWNFIMDDNGKVDVFRYEISAQRRLVGAYLPHSSHSVDSFIEDIEKLSISLAEITERLLPQP